MSESTTAERGAPRGRWIAVSHGYLYDPDPECGRVETRDGVAFWVVPEGEYVLDLTDAGLAEADRRNRVASRAEDPS